MRYLYAIFRLWWCPHHYEVKDIYNKTRKIDGTKVGIRYVNRCTRCGRMESFEVSL